MLLLGVDVGEGDKSMSHSVFPYGMMSSSNVVEKLPDFEAFFCGENPTVTVG